MCPLLGIRKKFSLVRCSFEEYIVLEAIEPRPIPQVHAKNVNLFQLTKLVKIYFCIHLNVFNMQK